MSIIHDALKRAQDELKKKNNNTSDNKKTIETPNIYNKLKTKTTPPIKSPERIESEKIASTQQSAHISSDKKKLSITFISLIAVFSLFIGVFISFLIVLLNQSPTRANIDTVDTTTPSTKKSSVQKNGLVLSGTMMMGEKRVALINGEIYELGEFVRGKKLTDVTLKTIELIDENGVKTNLSVRRGN